MGFQKTKTLLTGVLGHYAMLHKQRDNVIEAAKQHCDQMDSAINDGENMRVTENSLRKEVRKLRALEGE